MGLLGGGARCVWRAFRDEGEGSPVEGEGLREVHTGPPSGVGQPGRVGFLPAAVQTRLFHPLHPDSQPPRLALFDDHLLPPSPEDIVGRVGAHWGQRQATESARDVGELRRTKKEI